MLRILTGVIVPDDTKRSGGDATIIFNPHRIDAADATGSALESIGAAGNFDVRPGHAISMKEFVVQDRRKYSEDRTISDPFRIDEDLWNQDQIRVKWECESEAQIVKISYLIVGEACSQANKETRRTR
jgi:hypothetical protein